MTLTGSSPPSLGATRLIAVRVLQVLGEVGEIDQKGLAVEVEASESSLSRVLGKLAKMGWVTRGRGEWKELLVRLALVGVLYLGSRLNLMPRILV